MNFSLLTESFLTNSLLTDDIGLHVHVIVTDAHTNYVILKILEENCVNNDVVIIV